MTEPQRLSPSWCWPIDLGIKKKNFFEGAQFSHMTSIFGKFMESIVKDHLISESFNIKQFALSLFGFVPVLPNYFMYLIISLRQRLFC